MPERLKTLGCLPLPVGVLRTRRQIEIQDGARRKDDGDGEAGDVARARLQHPGLGDGA